MTACSVMPELGTPELELCALFLTLLDRPRSVSGTLWSRQDWKGVSIPEFRAVVKVRGTRSHDAYRSEKTRRHAWC